VVVPLDHEQVTVTVEARLVWRRQSRGSRWGTVTHVALLSCTSQVVTLSAAYPCAGSACVDFTKYSAPSGYITT
jgi:hypothetical protein